MPELPLKQTYSVKEKARELECKKKGGQSISECKLFGISEYRLFPGKHPWNEIQDSPGNEVSQGNASNLGRGILH